MNKDCPTEEGNMFTDEFRSKLDAQKKLHKFLTKLDRKLIKIEEELTEIAELEERLMIVESDIRFLNKLRGFMKD